MTAANGKALGSSQGGLWLKTDLTHDERAFLGIWM